MDATARLEKFLATASSDARLTVLIATLGVLGVVLIYTTYRLVRTIHRGCAARPSTNAPAETLTLLHSFECIPVTSAYLDRLYIGLDPRFLYSNINTGTPLDKRIGFFEKTFAGFHRYLLSEFAVLLTTACVIVVAFMIFFNIGSIERVSDGIVIWDFRYVSTGVTSAGLCFAVLAQFAAVSGTVILVATTGPLLGGFFMSVASRGLYQQLFLILAALSIGIHQIVISYKWVPQYSAFIPPRSAMIASVHMYINTLGWFIYMVLFIMGPQFGHSFGYTESYVSETVVELVLHLAAVISLLYITDDMEKYVISSVLCILSLEQDFNQAPQEVNTAPVQKPAVAAPTTTPNELEAGVAQILRHTPMVQTHSPASSQPTTQQRATSSTDLAKPSTRLSDNPPAPRFRGISQPVSPAQPITPTPTKPATPLVHPPARVSAGQAFDQLKAMRNQKGGILPNLNVLSTEPPK